MKGLSKSSILILYNKSIGLTLSLLLFTTFVVYVYINFVIVFVNPDSKVAPVPFVGNISNSNDLPQAAQIYNQNDVQISKKPYRFDSACRNFTKRLLKPGFFNLTALASFPGSGNTWARHLIELSTGLYTGSIYQDLELISKGFLGEKEFWDSGTTIVQKVHVKFQKDLDFHKAVLLIRDPYKSIVSFVQYLEAGHTAGSSGHIFRKRGWENYVLGQTYNWISLLKSWIQAPIPIHIIHYELLKANTSLQLQLGETCGFLNVKCVYLNSTCFKRHQEGEFHRKKKLPILPSFPDWVRKKMDRGIDYLNALLQTERSQALPLHEYPYYGHTSLEVP